MKVPADARRPLAPEFYPALAFGFVLLGYVLLRNASLLSDPDTQWHVAVGRWIWDHGTVPTTDIFSHTFAGSPWIAKEWVSQLLLFFADAAGGWWGVVLLTASAITLCFASLFDWLRRRMRPAVALAATLAAVALAQPHFLARPHILVLPLIFSWMALLADALERGEAPPLPAALIMIAWTNMHGSFPFGLVMAGVLAGEGVLSRPRNARLRAAGRWALFLAIAGAATMVSPFGWRTILVPLRMSGNAETLSFVGEWAPLGPDGVGAIAALVAATTFVLLLGAPRANLFRLAATGLVGYLMVRHVRFIGLFAVVAPVLAARSLALRFPPAPAAEHKPDRRAAAAVLAAATVAVIVAAEIRPRPSADVTPEAAYRAAMAAGVRGPVFNDYDFGGYLIAHGVKTFVDGRTDQLFLGAFLPDLARALADKRQAAFAAMLARSKVTWAMIRSHSAAAAHFDAAPGWTKLYGDSVASVYRADHA